MDADQFRRLETEFTAFLDRFGDCFSRKDTLARPILLYTCAGSSLRSAREERRAHCP